MCLFQASEIRTAHRLSPMFMVMTAFCYLEEDLEDGRVGVGEQDDGEEGAHAAVQHRRPDVRHRRLRPLVAAPCKEDSRDSGFKRSNALICSGYGFSPEALGFAKDLWRIMSLWKGGKQKRGLKQSCVGSRLTAQNSEGMRMQELLLVLSQVSIDYDLSPSTYPLKLYFKSSFLPLA